MTVSTSGSTTPATTEQAGPRASAAGPAEPAAGGLPGTGKVPAEPAEPAEPSEPAEPTASTGAAAGRATGAEGGRPVLSIDGLAVAYPGRGVRGGTVPVLSGVGLDVTAGQILGVIGETGSGKTTLARAVVGAAPVTAGRITVAGVGVGALRGRALREHRRSGRVQYMFQDPLRSLDPDLTVTDLVGEPLAVAGVERGERRARAAEALHRVGLDARALGDRIPAELSGGQRQRVSLARAIVTRPALLLADEPVSALDASNRNHVLRLLDELRRDLGVAIVVISHDLSSLAGIADRTAVLYRGRLIEQGPTAQVLSRPLHPYTALLTASAPRIGRSAARTPVPARTEPPDWAAQPGACVFAHRCPFADAACRTQPPDTPHPGGRAAACHHPIAQLAP